MKELKKNRVTFRRIVFQRFANLNAALSKLQKESVRLSAALYQGEHLTRSQDKEIKVQGHLFLHLQSRIDILEKKISDLTRSYLLIIILLTFCLIFGILSLIVN